jgi:hypothetical protein
MAASKIGPLVSAAHVVPNPAFPYIYIEFKASVFKLEKFLIRE